MIGEMGLKPPTTSVPGVGQVSVKMAWFDVGLEIGG
jgi:hypothetical protein